MSQWNSSKANYHPVSELAGNRPNGSYLLPGNEYYSVEGMAPRLQFEHSSKISPSRVQYSQSHRIDPLHSLMELKRQGTTLTKYSIHQPQVEMCRDRYIFVPTYLPRQEPNEYVKDASLEQFKRTVEDPKEYRLKDMAKIPDVDYHVLPREDPSDETYRIYQPTQPYDMMVLRDTTKYNLHGSDERRLDTNPNYISSTTIASKP